MANKLTLNLAYLYPEMMNIYGDTGNITALKKRAQWRMIELNIETISLKEKLNSQNVDLVFFGGGQDQAQKLVSQDLLDTGKSNSLKESVEKGVPLLSICGGYQLLGAYYQPSSGEKLKGANIFPVFTEPSSKRMIGNIIISLAEGFTANQLQARDKLVVGFENHSGQTFLKTGAKPFGKVIKGFGNNGEDKTEGCVYKNAIGTYLHGSLLPKNPKITDWLLTKALENKYQDTFELTPLDDNLETLAHTQVIQRYR